MEESMYWLIKQQIGNPKKPSAVMFEIAKRFAVAETELGAWGHEKDVWSHVWNKIKENK